MKVTLPRGLTREELLALRGQLLVVMKQNAEDASKADGLDHEFWEGNYQAHLNDLMRVEKALKKSEAS